MRTTSIEALPSSHNQSNHRRLLPEVSEASASIGHSTTASQRGLPKSKTLQHCATMNSTTTSKMLPQSAAPITPVSQCDDGSNDTFAPPPMLPRTALPLIGSGDPALPYLPLTLDVNKRPLRLQQRVSASRFHEVLPKQPFVPTAAAPQHSNKRSRPMFMELDACCDDEKPLPLLPEQSANQSTTILPMRRTCRRTNLFA